MHTRARARHISHATEDDTSRGDGKTTARPCGQRMNKDVSPATKHGRAGVPDCATRTPSGHATTESLGGGKARRAQTRARQQISHTPQKKGHNRGTRDPRRPQHCLFDQWNETCARGRMDAAQKKQNWGYRWCEEKKKRSVADVSFHSTYPRTQTRRKEKIQQSASFREECAGTNTHGSWKLHDSTICGSICKRSPHGAGICKQSPALRWNLFFPDSRGLRRVRR